MAMYLLLDEVLPLMKCEKIKKEGSYECDRCDTCMKEQYIKRIKEGEIPKINKLSEFLLKSENKKD